MSNNEYNNLPAAPTRGYQFPYGSCYLYHSGNLLEWEYSGKTCQVEYCFKLDISSQIDQVTYIHWKYNWYFLPRTETEKYSIIILSPAFPGFVLIVMCCIGPLSIYFGVHGLMGSLACVANNVDMGGGGGHYIVPRIFIGFHGFIGICIVCCICLADL